MKRFINVSPSESKILYKPIFENATILLKDADIIALKNKSYAHGSSLLILSLEETIKSILVLLHSQEYPIYRIRDAKKFFFDHKIRHQIAKVVEVTYGSLKSLANYEANHKEKGNGFLDSLISLFESIQPLIESFSSFELLDGLNQDKNMGFYVDFRDKLLVPSEEIGKEKFIEVRHVLKKIMYCYKGLNILFHPMIENHLNEGDVLKFRKDLKEILNSLFIDNID